MLEIEKFNFGSFNYINDKHCMKILYNFFMHLLGYEIGRLVVMIEYMYSMIVSDVVCWNHDKIITKLTILHSQPLVQSQECSINRWAVYVCCQFVHLISNLPSSVLPWDWLTDRIGSCKAGTPCLPFLEKDGKTWVFEGWWFWTAMVKKGKWCDNKMKYELKDELRLCYIIPSSEQNYNDVILYFLTS